MKAIIKALEKEFDEVEEDETDEIHPYSRAEYEESDKDSSSDYNPNSDDYLYTEDECDKCMNDTCNNLVYREVFCCGNYCGIPEYKRLRLYG